MICPYDSNHRMPKSSLAKHVESCRLRKLGYTKEEEVVCVHVLYMRAVPSVHEEMAAFGRCLPICLQ